MCSNKEGKDMKSGKVKEEVKKKNDGIECVEVADGNLKLAPVAVLYCDRQPSPKGGGRFRAKLTLNLSGIANTSQASKIS